MSRRIFFFTFFMVGAFFLGPTGGAQDTVHTGTDSLPTSFLPSPKTLRKDTAKVYQPSLGVSDDSLLLAPNLTGRDTMQSKNGLQTLTRMVLYRRNSYDSLMEILVQTHPLLRNDRPVVYEVMRPRNMASKDWLFYLLLGVCFLLAAIRLTFYKYFKDLFRAFFNPTLSQRQLREQLAQTPIPSMVMNFFFAVSMGLFLFLVMQYRQFTTQANLALLIPALILLIGAIYLFKFLFLRFSGWLFGSRELVAAYIFILYLINKVMGVVLVPFLVILAFSPDPIAEVSLYISVFIIVLLIVYRYVRAYGLVKNYISIGKFHFFIYLCGFEIVPVLIIAKWVLLWLKGNA